jgi:hypothetical protein
MQQQGAVTHNGITLEAYGYMDTVSQIRGKIGRGPLPEADKVYFMKKRENLVSSGRIQGT